MSDSVLTPFDLTILRGCSILWASGVWQNAIDLQNLGINGHNLKEFIEECISNIQDPSSSKVEWNTHIQTCKGDNFGYAWLFPSKITKKMVKLALNIESETNTIVVGVMKVALDKEAKRCLSHIGREKK